MAFYSIFNATTGTSRRTSSGSRVSVSTSTAAAAIAHDGCNMRNRCKALDEARREQWLYVDVWSRGVHEKQIGTRLEYRSPEYLALEKALKEWKASFAAAGANLLPAT